MIYSVCDKGIKRDINQDCIYTSEKLLVVADGLGGHNAGEVASNMACIEIQKYEDIKLNDASIRKAFDDINTKIYNAQLEDEKLHFMGTTLTAIWLKKREVWIGHIGDSRAYRLRDGEFQRLTQDHSYVGNLLSLNIITEEEARVHKYRNQIDRAIGIQKDIICDVIHTDIKKGDIFLLCSDGLTSMVPANEIRDVLMNNCDNPSQELVNLANHHGGLDNISAIVYKEC